MREFNKYPHHEDIYPKHKITSSELCFLAELQKEMNTQDTWAQADPRIWVIQEDKIQYLEVINDMINGGIINDEKIIQHMINESDGFQFFIDSYCCESAEELYKVIKSESILEDSSSAIPNPDPYDMKNPCRISFTQYHVKMENDEIIVKVIYTNTDGAAIETIWKGIPRILELLKFATSCEVKLMLYKNITDTHRDNFFLTYEEGIQYLQKFADRYSNTVRLYAMSLDETLQIKQLFDILHTVEFSKKNQKIYISGPITGTDDYLDRFAEAEKALKEMGYINIVNPAEEGTKLPEDSSYEDYMRLSFDLMKDCDVIYLLKGWKKSPGANQEYGYAIAKGMEIKYEGIY